MNQQFIIEKVITDLVCTLRCPVNTCLMLAYWGSAFYFWPQGNILLQYYKWPLGII